MKEKVKAFPSKQNLREFMPNRPVLQKMLKGALQVEMKKTRKKLKVIQRHTEL